MEKGGKINMPTNPPQIHYQPWYNLTLAISHNGGLDLTPSGIVDKIRSQLDPHSHGFIPKDREAALPFRLQFRIHSVRTWNLSGRQIGLVIDDFSVHNAKDQEQICGLVDCGTSLHVPACGFKLPSSLATLVMRNDADDKDDKILHVIAPSGSACMTYIELTWRFDGPLKLSSQYWFQPDLQKLLSSSNRIKDATTETSNLVSQITDLLRNQLKCGYVDTAINGIAKTAEVVYAAGTTSLSSDDRDLLLGIRNAIQSLNLDGVSEASMLNDVQESIESDLG